MKRKLFILIALIATQALAQDVWDVTRCMEYAVTHNHEVTRKQLSFDNYQAEHLNAVGNFLPAIDANVGAQYNFGRAIDPETNTYTNVSTFYNGYALSAHIPVFDAMGRIHALKAAKADILMGKNALRQQQGQTALDTYQAFIHVVYYQGMVKMATEKLHESQGLVRQTRAMKEVGRKSQADLAQMEAEEAEATYQLTTYQNQLASAMLSLKQQMNYPIDQPLNVIHEDSRRMKDMLTPLEIQPNDSSLFILHASFPSLQQAYHAQQSAYHQWRQARANFFPTLSLSAGLSTTYFKTLHSTTATPFHRQFSNNMGEYIAATLSIPIFNRLSTVARAKKAKNNYLIAKEDYEQKRMELEKLSQEAWQDMKAYTLQAQQAYKKVTADSIAYLLTRRQYEEGLATAIELHNTASNLLNSQSTLLQCQLMARMKELLVRYYNGEEIWQK